MKLKQLIAAAFVGFLAMTATAIAGPEVNTSTGIVLVNGRPAPGLAVHGFDVVAYHTKGKPLQGDAKFAVVHKQATYRFTSAEHLKAFKADPDKYVPAYGGYCAYGVSVGAKFDGDPRYWKIVDGRLYLNLDQNIYALFLKDVPGTIAKANANWPKLRDKNPNKTS